MAEFIEVEGGVRVRISAISTIGPPVFFSSVDNYATAVGGWRFEIRHPNAARGATRHFVGPFKYEEAAWAFLDLHFPTVELEPEPNPFA